MLVAERMRQKRRRWVGWLVLGLIACGSVVAYRVFIGVRLHPMTVWRLPVGAGLHFSAGGMGYPAIAILKEEFTTPNNACWLSDDGHTLPGEFHLADNSLIGPQREVVVGYQVSNGHFVPVYAWRDGRRERFMVDGRNPYYGANEQWFLTDDPRYHVTRRYAWPYPPSVPFVLQKRRGSGHDTFTFADQGAPGVVFHHGRRFLVAVATGRVRVYEAGKCIAEFGTKNTVWQWGEDGTVWTVQGTRVSVVEWHAGPCRLVTPPIPVRNDPAVHYLANGSFSLAASHVAEIIFSPPRRPFPPAGTAPAVAVWGDGRMVATTRTVTRWSTPTKRLINRLPSLRNITNHARVLTLYRNGRRVGRFTLDYTPTPTPSPTMPLYLSLTQPGYGEHIAFSRDGRYLSWTVQHKDQKTLYIFRM